MLGPYLPTEDIYFPDVVVSQAGPTCPIHTGDPGPRDHHAFRGQGNILNLLSKSEGKMNIIIMNIPNDSCLDGTHLCKSCKVSLFIYAVLSEGMVHESQHSPAPGPSSPTPSAAVTSLCGVFI